MSKIVAVKAERGWISADELERIVRDGYPSHTDLLSDEKGNTAPTVHPNRVAAPATACDSETEIVQGDGEVSTRRHSSKTKTGRIKRSLANAPDDHRSGEASSENRSEPYDHSKATLRAIQSSHSSKFETVARDAWNWQIPDIEFAQALTSLRDVFQAESPELYFEDIVVAILALTVRPVVLLAGPPGCGKSTLVRIIARLMGKESGDSFHDVAVQAHWDSDKPLFDENGQLTGLLTDLDKAHLVLLDEFNLTRPEYYLSRLFHALESDSRKLSPSQRIASCRFFGTLNIDESSRPPSPKVIDRCFLLELSQVSFDTVESTNLIMPDKFNALQGLPEVSLAGPISDERIDGAVRALDHAVQNYGLRLDLLPSRRVLNDIRAMLSLHHRLDLQGRNLLERNDLVDRLIASRILMKLSGAFDQLSPALDALEEFSKDLEELPRTQRRLKLARQQARLGFVSPWQ